MRKTGCGTTQKIADLSAPRKDTLYRAVLRYFACAGLNGSQAVSSVHHSESIAFERSAAPFSKRGVSLVIASSIALAIFSYEKVRRRGAFNLSAKTLVSSRLAALAHLGWRTKTTGFPYTTASIGVPPGGQTTTSAPANSSSNLSVKEITFHPGCSLS